MTTTFDQLVEMGEQDIVLYTRMSLLREEGIERQRKETVPHLERLGFEVVMEFSDDGKSATKDNVRRDAFEDLLDLARARRQRYGDGTYTKVGCWHSDRFARRVKELLRVEEAGILLYGKNSGYFDLSTPAGVATAITVTAWAEYEGKQKALRQKASHLQRAEKGRGWWMNRPFGYSMDGTRHQLEGAILVSLYDDVLAGGSLLGLCKRLNAQGVTTSMGKQWRPGSMRSLLMAPRNAGIITYNGVELGLGNWEALIAEEKFRAVVRILSDPARLTPGPRLGRGGRSSLLAGFATCSKCDATVRVLARKGYQVYLCRNGCCSARVDWVDERVEAIIAKRLSVDGELMGRLTGAESDDAAEMRNELDRLRRKADERQEMFDEDEITREQFTTFNRKNRTKIEELTRDLTAVGLDNAMRKLVGVPDLKKHWRDEMDVHARYAIVTQFFDRIVINPRGYGAKGMKRGDVELWVAGYEVPVIPE